MRKVGYLKYKTAPVNPEDAAEHEAARIKAIEASTGKPYSEWLKTQNKEHREESKCQNNKQS